MWNVLEKSHQQILHSIVSSHQLSQRRRKIGLSQQPSVRESGRLMRCRTRYCRSEGESAAPKPYRKAGKPRVFLALPYMPVKVRRRKWLKNKPMPPAKGQGKNDGKERRQPSL
jgi:hypothetical protein